MSFVFDIYELFGFEFTLAPGAYLIVSIEDPIIGSTIRRFLHYNYMIVYPNAYIGFRVFFEGGCLKLGLEIATCRPGKASHK